MNRRIPLAVRAAALLPLAAGCSTMKSPVTGPSACTLEQVVQVKVKTNYLLYLPDGYARSRQHYPLMLFLHGAGERGNDVEKVKLHGPPKLIAQNARKFPFVVVSPQCPDQDWWSSDTQVAALDGLINEIVSHYRIDPDRIYVTGLSMGGFGTWRLAAQFPDRFAAIAPICGRGDPQTAPKISRLPIWVFHGADDPVVPPTGSSDMVDALRKAGSDVKFTVYPKTGHDSWTKTYENEELYDWLLQQRRSAKR